MNIGQAGLAGDQNIIRRLKPQQIRCRTLVRQIQGGTEGPVKQGSVANDFSARQRVQVSDDGPVERDTAGKNNGCRKSLAVNRVS